jgi:hypothetical protein
VPGASHGDLDADQARRRQAEGQLAAVEHRHDIAHLREARDGHAGRDVVGRAALDRAVLAIGVDEHRADAREVDVVDVRDRDVHLDDRVRTRSAQQRERDRLHG